MVSRVWSSGVEINISEELVASIFRVEACRVRIWFLPIISIGLDCGSIVVKALCYKLEGRGFDSR
jgi:hypothetical protein